MPHCLPPDTGFLIKLHNHHLPTRRAATANQLDAEGPRSKVQGPRSANFGLWTLDFGLWTYEPLHIGPRRLATIARWTHEQSKCPAIFGRQLQAAKIMHVDLSPLAPNGSHAGTPQRLIQSP